MHTRNFYIQRIAPFLGKPVIKVITGMRRSGKSFLLRQLMRKLRDEGMPEQNIVYVDKEDLAFDMIRDYRDLAAHVGKALSGTSGRVAICVDEIQTIEGWERAVASWNGKPGYDILITGSNARLLSSELATLLSGRYIEFPVRPLSYAEFLQFRFRPADVHEETEFQNYLHYGGLPALHDLGTLSEETAYPYLTAIFNTVLFKDVVTRHQIRNVALLERLARYVFDNTGNLLNASRVVAFLKNQRVKAGVDTILAQLQWLADAHLTERVLLYDLKGKRHLEFNEKHYLADFGLRHAVLGYRPGDIGGLLENVVYLELRRRGWTVSVGRLGAAEVDFVAERAGDRAYFQVAYLTPTNETLERELRPLQAIDDNFPKILLTLDRARAGNYLNGIVHRWLPEFLLAG
ncbi:MAG: ATP-binding protein [Opitutaceae bacterium]|nr:ATP-binding protein [Opitutaceae bacterium]